MLAVLRQSPKWFTGNGMVTSAMLKSPADASEREILGETIQACEDLRNDRMMVTTAYMYAALPMSAVHPSVTVGIIGTGMGYALFTHHRLTQIKHKIESRD